MPMSIKLDHTIVPSHDKEAAARFFARMFDLPYDGADYFAPVRVNKELTLDFASASNVDVLHYAFLVSEEEFDAIHGRIQAEGVSYGSGPSSADDGTINTRRGGRGLYFTGGPDPHLWEIMTRPETGS
jgi:catechol 2,3-dioxygenase-like lactoylglutathione lyase family enzyme